MPIDEKRESISGGDDGGKGGDGYRWMMEELEKICSERRESSQLTFRIGGGDVLRVAKESRRRWTGLKEASVGRTGFLEEEKRRIVEQERKLGARKEEIEAELEEERILLGQVEEQLARLEGFGSEEEVLESWVLETDAACGCPGACGCVEEVKFKVGRSGEEGKEIVLKGSWMEKEERVEEVMEVAKEEGGKEEEERKVVEGERSQVMEAQLQAKQLTSKMREAFGLKEWSIVQKYKEGFDAAWAVLKRSEPAGGWEERWYSLRAEACLLFGKAMANLGRWGAVETVVGRPGDGGGKAPKVGDEGFSSERVVEWLLLRARARAAVERWEAAFFDLKEAEQKAGRRRWLMGEAERTRKQVERMRREAEERKREERRRKGK